MSTMSDLVVKTVFTEDVRRFKLSRASLVLLRDLISKTYEKLPSGFLIKYTDPEGDACSIGSDAELEEAFNISGSTLKLDIVAVDDGRAPRIELPKSSPPPEDSEPESFEVVNEPASEPALSEPAFPEPVPQPAESKEKEEIKDQDESETETDACALVLELAQDPEVQAKFPEMFKSIVATIERGAADLRSILSDLFGAVPSLKEHPTIKKILPVLVKNGEKINASLERIKNFLPMVLPFLKDLPTILPQLLASIDLEHLREHLKSVFEGQGFPFDVCGEEEDAEGTPEEKESQQPTHANIKCDGCGVLPISGDRYKCTVCPDFDLCASCEKRDIHPSSHPLLKLKEPARRDIHHGVTCDGCGKKPIEGVRYKCLACPNFDLCSQCEEKNQHPSDHTLLKLKEHNSVRVKQQQHRGFGPWAFGRGGPHGHGPHGHHGHHHGHHGHHGPHGPHGHGHHGPSGFHHHGHGFFGLLKSLGLFGGVHQGEKSARHAEKCARRAEKCLRKEEASQEKLTRRVEKCTRKAEAVQEKCARKAEKCARRVEKWARSGSKCHGRKRQSEFAAEFVQDINIRDGATLAPGAVVKQWRLKNTGSAKWPEGSKVIFLRGARELLGEQEEFAVPLAEPGHTVDVAVPLLVPEKAGSYSAKFQLADKDRAVFGHRFWVEFIVKEEEKLLSSAPSSPMKETKESTKEVEVKETKKVVQGLTSTIPVPSTGTGVSVSIPVPSKYASSLGVLEKMGFVNEKLNTSLLDRSQGNIEQVVTWLLEMENSKPARV